MPEDPLSTIRELHILIPMSGLISRLSDLQSELSDSDRPTAHVARRAIESAIGTLSIVVDAAIAEAANSHRSEKADRSTDPYILGLHDPGEEYDDDSDFPL